MNTKNNKRRQQTQSRIEKVFLELLETQPLNKISVTEICARAQINRSTFYASYLDVYDLAEQLRQRLLEGVEGLMIRDIAWYESKDSFLSLFRHIRDNPMLYRLYFRLGYEASSEEFLIKTLPSDQDDMYLEYYLEFFKTGFNAIVKKWISGGCRETPEQMLSVLLHEYRGREEKQP